MKLSHSILAILLVAQLVVAGGLYYSGQSKIAVRPEGALLEFDNDNVDRIELEDQQGSIALVRKDDGWVLPDYNNVPALQGKVDSMLESLNGVKTGWAVATKTASHQQLEVADDNFNRKIRLADGDQTLAEIYVGTSPGLRRSHARQGDNDEVYAVALNSYDLPAERSQWLVKDILSADEVSRVSVSGNTLERVDDVWKLSDSDGTQQDADPDSAQAFVDSIKTLSVLDVVDNEPDGELETTTITVEGDEALTYTFLGADDDSYFVRRSDVDALFKISMSDFESIAQVDLQELLPEPPEQNTDTQDSDTTDSDSQSESASQSATEGVVEDPAKAE